MNHGLMNEWACWLIAIVSGILWYPWLRITILLTVGLLLAGIFDAGEWYRVL
jgi:hypothetical protein